VLHYLELYGQGTDTAWSLNTGQEHTKRPISTSHYGHDCFIGQNYSINGNIFCDFENWQLNRGWLRNTGCKKNNSNTVSTEEKFDVK